MDITPPPAPAVQTCDDCPSPALWSIRVHDVRGHGLAVPFACAVHLWPLLDLWLNDAYTDAVCLPTGRCEIVRVVAP